MDYKLTVLLMTYRATYFEEALLSVLNQTFRDFKIIVSDNTEQSIIINQFKLRYTDPRIYWVHAWPHTNGDGTSHWNYVRNYVDTKYFKYMFDDDILYPTSFQHLYSILESDDEFACAFHGRHVINGQGEITAIDSWYQGRGVVVGNELDFSLLIFNSVVNLFGEPPFSMYRTQTLGNPVDYEPSFDGWPLKFDADVAMVLKLAQRGKVAGSCASLGAFRVHNMQDSGTLSRLEEKVEWELICRVLNSHHTFDRVQVENTCRRLIKMYEPAYKEFVILRKFADNLELCISNGILVPDRAFYDLWVESRELLDLPVIDFPDVY